MGTLLIDLVLQSPDSFTSSGSCSPWLGLGLWLEIVIPDWELLMTVLRGTLVRLKLLNLHCLGIFLHVIKTWDLLSPCVFHWGNVSAKLARLINHTVYLPGGTSPLLRFWYPSPISPARLGMFTCSGAAPFSWWWQASEETATCTVVPCSLWDFRAPLVSCRSRSRSQQATASSAEFHESILQSSTPFSDLANNLCHSV